jgi:hypothetical protein
MGFDVPLNELGYLLSFVAGAATCALLIFLFRRFSRK